MRNGKKVEDLIIASLDKIDTRLDKVDKKLDDVLVRELPTIKTEVAVMAERTSRSTRVITLAGGAIAVLTSLGASIAIALWK